MDWNRQACILIYSLILVQSTLTLAITYIKVNRSAALYTLNATQILIMLWLIFGMHEIQSQNTAELLFAVRLTLFPMSFISGTWLIFTLIYTGVFNPSNRIIYGVVLIPQMITYFPLLTNKWFHLAIEYKDYSDPGHTIWGPAMDINFNMSYVYLILSFIVLLYYAAKTFRAQRVRVIILALSPTVPFITNVIYHYKWLPDPGFNVTPITFSLMLLVQAVATFRYRAFDQLHHGAVEIYQNMDESLIIIDNQNRVVDLNSYAENEFRTLIDSVPDFNSDDILYYIRRLRKYAMNQSAVNDIIAALDNHQSSFKTQLILSDSALKNERRYYDFSMKRIYDNRKKGTGYVLAFKNRTEQSKALLESEHKRISRDIHDGLNNLVNVVSMNLEYALKTEMPTEEVRNCIEVAFTTNNRMRFEIRKILDELVPLDIEKNGLMAALSSLFKRVTGTGIEIDFTPIGITDALDKNLALGLLLYSTCLEGINNAMYNGKARHISVVIIQKEEQIRFVLSDDGMGCNEIIPGRGLEGIEQRVNTNNGKVIFESDIDNGFSIAMELPFTGGKDDD